MSSALRCTLVVALVGLALGACRDEPPAQPPVATPTPSAPASPEPTASASPVPTATPSAALPAGVYFRERFDGARLDPASWTVYERGGVVHLRDGKVELLVGGLSRVFPLLIATKEVLPRSGPFYFELRYVVQAPGYPVSFNLDYVPPASADDPGVTAPFLQTDSMPANQGSQPDMSLTLRTETAVTRLPARGGLKPEQANKLRIEYDDRGGYRFWLNEVDLGKVDSRRRPTRFWVGTYPNTPVATTPWMRLAIDSIESGTLGGR